MITNEKYRLYALFLCIVVLFLTGCSSQIVRTELLDKGIFETASHRANFDASSHLNSVYNFNKETGEPIVVMRPNPSVTPTVPGQTIVNLLPALAGAGATITGGFLYRDAIKASSKIGAETSIHLANKNAETTKYVSENQKPGMVLNLVPQANSFADSFSQSMNQNSSNSRMGIGSGIEGDCWGDGSC